MIDAVIDAADADNADNANDAAAIDDDADDDSDDDTVNKDTDDGKRLTHGGAKMRRHASCHQLP